MLIPFNELFSRYQIKASGVLHLGANTGQEADAYWQQKIHQVIWIEAFPELYEKLVRNIAQFQGHSAIQACVSDIDGQEVEFHYANNGGQSSSFLELGTHAQEHPTVRYVRTVKMKTSRVDTLLGNQIMGNDWFLNADLQGTELLALKGMGDLLWQFKYAYIEVNTAPLYKGCPLVGEIDEYLAKFGFVGMETKMTGAKWGDKFYSRPI